MHFLWTRRVTVVCLWGLLCSAGSVVLAADEGAVLEHIPAESCLVLESRVLGEACAAFGRSSFGAEWCGEQFAPWRNALAERGQASAFNLAPAFGFAWPDLAEIDDPSALALIPLPDRTLGAAWIFVSGAPLAGDPPALSAAAAGFARQGLRETRSELPGGVQRSFAPPAPGGPALPRVIFRRGPLYGVASSPAAAQAVLAVRAERSLLRDAAYQASRIEGDGPPRLGALGIFLRPFVLWERLAESSAQPKSAPRPLAAARRLGLDGVSSVGARLYWHDAGDDEWRLDARLLVKRPLERALRLAALEPGALPDVSAPPRPGCTSAWWMRCDFVTLMQGFANWYDESTEPGPDGVGLFDDMLDALRDDTEGVRVDLRRDVFARLGPQAEYATDAEGWLWSIAVQDPQPLVDTFERYYRGDRRVARAEVGRFQLWTVGERMSLLVEGESSTSPSTRALAVGEGRLWLASQPERLEQSLRERDAAPPAGSDWERQWAALHRDQGPQTAARGLMRLGSALEPSYSAAARPLERGAGADHEPPLAWIWRAILYGTTEPPGGLPYALLPPFTQLESAGARSRARVDCTADGFVVRLHTQRLPSSK